MNNKPFDDDFFDKAFSSELKTVDASKHPSFQELFMFISKEDDSETRARISTHIATCDDCQQRVAAIEADVSAIHADLEEQLPPPTPTATWKAASRSWLQSAKQSLDRWIDSLIPSGSFGPRWALVAVSAAVVIMMVGGMGTLFLQMLRLESQIASQSDAGQILATIASLNTQIENLSSDNVDEIARLEGVIHTLEQSLLEAGQTTASSIQELQQEIASSGSGILLEGGRDDRRLAGVVHNDLTYYVRVLDRINDVVVFEGILKAGSSFSAFGQSLMVSWSLADGADAVKLRGWNQVRVGEDAEGWYALEPSAEITSEPLACGDVYVIYFPALESGVCP